MSEKELLYTEDVLSHLQNISEYLDNYKECVDDANFKKVLEDLESLTKSVYNLIEE